MNLGRPQVGIVDRVVAAVSAEEREGLLFATKIRLYLLIGAAVWLSAGLLVNWRGQIFYHGVVVAFIALGLLEAWLLRVSRQPRWVAIAFAAADAILLGAALIAPNPLLQEQFSPVLQLHGSTVIWFILLLVLRGFSLEPLLVLWAGACSVAGWAVVLIAAIADPRSRVEFAVGALPEDGEAQLYALMGDPSLVSTGKWGTQAVILLLIAVGLTGIVMRCRRLALQRASAERARANLSRYFSPRMVEQLQAQDQPLAAVRRQNVGILFADIVGFTTMAERMPAEQVMAFLRDYHRRMESAVFEFGGSLEKFIGDALLATFGVPDSTPCDAVLALRCAWQMMDAVKDWNSERVALGMAEVNIGIGLHYGPAVMGDIGSERSMTFAVVGDSINLASRLQNATREYQCSIVASDAFIQQARQQGLEAQDLRDLKPNGVHQARGRGAGVEVWCGGVGS